MGYVCFEDYRSYAFEFLLMEELMFCGPTGCSDQDACVQECEAPFVCSKCRIATDVVFLGRARPSEHCCVRQL